jgi:hypothetical protein
MYVENSESSFANKLLGYLQEADYRIARTEDEQLPINKLRYEAYLQEGAIYENPSKVLHDRYDEMENCWNFGIYIDGVLASAVRCHLISPEFPQGPAYDFYPDIIRPMIGEGKLLVDPTRFVANREMSAKYPELPYLTLRAACMTYDYFDADYCLASVRKEHRAFYRRVFRAEILCDPRPYPPLTVQLGLMKTNVASFRSKLLRRYPIFESSYTERRLLFGNGGGPLGHRLNAPEAVAASVQ